MERHAVGSHGKAREPMGTGSWAQAALRLCWTAALREGSAPRPAGARVQRGRGGGQKQNPQPRSRSPWQQDALGLHSGMEQRLLGQQRLGLRAGLQVSGVREAAAGARGGGKRAAFGIQGIAEKPAGRAVPSPSPSAPGDHRGELGLRRLFSHPQPQALSTARRRPRVRGAEGFRRATSTSRASKDVPGPGA